MTYKIEIVKVVVTPTLQIRDEKGIFAEFTMQPMILYSHQLADLAGIIARQVDKIKDEQIDKLREENKL